MAVQRRKNQGKGEKIEEKLSVWKFSKVKQKKRRLCVLIKKEKVRGKPWKHGSGKLVVRVQFTEETVSSDKASKKGAMYRLPWLVAATTPTTTNKAEVKQPASVKV